MTLSKDIRKHISKYRTKYDKDVHPGSIVLFPGTNYNKGIVQSVSGDAVQIKVPRRMLDLLGADLEELPGSTYKRHIDEVIVREPIGDDTDIRYLLVNKFDDEKVGDVTIKWDDNLTEDLMSYIECHPIVLVTADGTPVNYVRYTKNDQMYLIPSTSILAVPRRIFQDRDIGIDKNFKMTTELSEIAYPIGSQTNISIASIKNALLSTVDARKQMLMDELANVRNQITQTTEALSGYMVRQNEVSKELAMLDTTEVNEEYVQRAQRILNSQWDEFYTEARSGQTIATYAGDIIYEHSATHKYDLGYITVKVTFPAHGSRGNPNIRIDSTRKRGGHPHPYVNEAGSPCFGGKSAQVAKILSSGDIEAIGSFLHGFLTKAKGSGYHSPSAWPRV